MNRPELLVAVTGRAKSGKSRLVSAMSDDLVARGYAVIVTDEGQTIERVPDQEPVAHVRIATQTAYKGQIG